MAVFLKYPASLMSCTRVNKSVKVFEFNVKENPASFNASDGLAEAYFNKAQITGQPSILYYNKAKAGNP